jgi:hypothetical protein
MLFNWMNFEAAGGFVQRSCTKWENPAKLRVTLSGLEQYTTIEGPFPRDYRVESV